MKEVKITKQRLKELKRKEAKLYALEAGGIDNWTNYDDCMEKYNKEIEKEDKLSNLLYDIEIILFEHAYEPAGTGAGYASGDEDFDKALEVLTKAFNERND